MFCQTNLRFDPKIYLPDSFYFCMQNFIQATNNEKHSMVRCYRHFSCKGTQLSKKSKLPCLMSVPLKQDRNIGSSDFNLQGHQSLTEKCVFHCFQIKWLDFFRDQFKDIPKTEIGEKEEVVVYATRYLAALSLVIDKATKE